MNKNLTKRQKVVLVAKDVLKHLKCLKIKKGIYLAGKIPSNFPKTGNAQKYIDKIQEKCQVCALGACFISNIRLFNKVNIEDLIYCNNNDGKYSLYGGLEIHKTLKSIFTEKELNYIESFFEGWTEKEFAFSKKHKSPKLMLKAIMENIIENNRPP